MKLIALAAAGSALAIGVVAAQTQDKVLTSKAGDFLFCIDQDRSGGAKAVNFTGQGRVIYRPMPVPGMPDAMVGKTPESVASVLTVIAGTGEAWLFVAKGQAALDPPGAGARVTTVPVSIVRKTDWSAPSGPRRGTDIASCLIAAG